MPMTAQQFLESCDKMIHDVCSEEGIDYDEFMLNLAVASNCEIVYTNVTE